LTSDSDKKRDFERNPSSSTHRTTENSRQQARTNRPHPPMSMWRNLFLMTPREFQARIKKNTSVVRRQRISRESLRDSSNHASRAWYRHLRIVWQRVDESCSFSQANHYGARAAEVKYIPALWRRNPCHAGISKSSPAL
jgi:hypothetical protein